MGKLLLTVAALGVLGFAFAEDPKSPKQDAPQPNKEAAVTAQTATSPLDFTLKDIDGKDVALSKYSGKVVLIVNVASRCGMTPQYEQLEQLHKKYAGQGLAILGFPCNDFGGQEPGSPEEIKEFCKSKYGVEFDLFAKVAVGGDGSAELYKYLTSKERNGEFGGSIRWNFTKFLVDRSGKVIARYEPRTRPDEAPLITALEAALAAKP